LLASALAALTGTRAVLADNKIPDELQGVGIAEHLGGAVSIQDLQFNNEKGEAVKLSSYFRKGHPVLLTLVYYQCPNLCGFLLNGLVTSLKSLDWTPGKQFDIVTVSINPKEGPALASAKKSAIIGSYGKPEAAEGWHFLTGDEAQIRRLADQVGFGYHYDDKELQYAHSSVIFALTPEGKISRYLYGIEFPQKDLRLAMLEASDGKIGTVVDRLLLFCYHYDPKTGKYSLIASRVMNAGGAGTVLIFGGYLAVFWRRQRKRGDFV
jgi:protein SCO1/2